MAKAQEDGGDTWSEVVRQMIWVTGVAFGVWASDLIAGPQERVESVSTRAAAGDCGAARIGPLRPDPLCDDRAPEAPPRSDRRPARLR